MASKRSSSTPLPLIQCLGRNTRQATNMTPPTKVTAEDDVLPYARKRKVFSTGSVASDFHISSGSATALVAILRIKRCIEKDGKAADGTSQWRFVG